MTITIFHELLSSQQNSSNHVELHIFEKEKRKKRVKKKLTNYPQKKETKTHTNTYRACDNKREINALDMQTTPKNKNKTAKKNTRRVCLQ
jgi:hypothetical protein